MNVRRATPDGVESSKPTGTGGAVRAAILTLVLSRLLAAVTSAAPPLAAKEVREQRWMKEETPLWREALALPQTALGVVAWPGGDWTVGAMTRVPLDERSSESAIEIETSHDGGIRWSPPTRVEVAPREGAPQVVRVERVTR